MNVFKNKYGGKKTFIVSKVPEESPLRCEINSCFEETDKYLKINPSMIVGRLIQGPRTDEELKIIPHSIVGPVSLFKEAINLKKSHPMSLRYSIKLSSNQMPQMKREEKKKPNFETVDESKLKNIYREYLNLKMVNQDKANEFLKALPEEVKDRLKYQENNLSVHQSELNRFNRMVKFLSKRTKKEEDALLVNKTDALRMKREVNEIIESKKPLEERYGPHNWNMSLRRPKNFSGTRHAYINLGNEMHPVWLGIKETIPKSVELVRQPNSKSIREFENFTNNRYLLETTENTNSINFAHLKNLNNLEIKGEDLLKCELDSMSILQGKKILYKREYLDSLTGNCHPSNNNTLVDYTKVNRNLVNSQVFASNYDSRNFYKEMSTLNLRK